VEVLPVDGYRGILLRLMFRRASPLGDLPRRTELPHDPPALFKYLPFLICF